MTTAAAATPDVAALRHLLPEPLLGTVTSVTPLHLGFSGASVHAVASTRGDYVLRVLGERADRGAWARELTVLRRAAACGIAPPIVHVDEDARALLSVRVAGVPLHVALADPAQRQAAMTGTVAQVRAVHALDSDGIEGRDVVGFARGLWEGQRGRPGFPAWGTGIDAVLDAIAARLDRDPRRVVSHNDLNPGNVIWDGTRAWLVDWATAGLAHPYYDLAVLATFLDLDAGAAEGLLALQERAPLDEDARATFRALRQAVALAAGCMSLSAVPDRELPAVPPLADAPPLGACLARLGAGTLQEHGGLAALGVALLRVGIEPAAPAAAS